MTIRNLEFAFQPKSVALIGASPQPGSVGLTVLRNLRTGGFSGQVWLVNPNHAEVEGVRCYPDAASLPETPDLAVIATPAETVPAIVAELGRKGTRAAVVLTAGLTKANGLRQAMLDAAKPFCMRLIGPNCLGLFVPQHRAQCKFRPYPPQCRASGAAVAIRRGGERGARLGGFAGHRLQPCGLAGRHGRCRCRRHARLSFGRARTRQPF